MYCRCVLLPPVYVSFLVALSEGGSGIPGELVERAQPWRVCGSSGVEVVVASPGCQRCHKYRPAASLAHASLARSGLLMSFCKPLWRARAETRRLNEASQTKRKSYRRVLIAALLDSCSISFIVNHCLSLLLNPMKKSNIP